MPPWPRTSPIGTSKAQASSHCTRHSRRQYEELFIAIDVIAERIRALDAYAIGGLSTLAGAAKMREFVSPLSQEDYVRSLIRCNEKLVANAKRARDLAGQADDPESQDLMVERVSLHEKTIWMLKSFLKG